MPKVDPIIADDALLLSVEASTLLAAAVTGDVSSNTSTVVTAHVDHVFGTGLAGVFVAGPKIAGKRSFHALVCDANAQVRLLTGMLNDTVEGLSVVTVTDTALSGTWNLDFPHYFSGIATASTLTATIDGKPWSTSTGYTISLAGQVLLRTSPAADITTAKVYTARTFSGTSLSFLPFPNDQVPVTSGTGSQSVWQSPERRLFQGVAVDRTGVTDTTSLGVLSISEEQRIHGIVGAPFGDLEYDVGKSVPWTRLFTDDLFITDINSGDPRYYVIDWDKTSPESKYVSLGVDYFTNAAGWRKAQFAAADAAWGYANDDWVLFVDASEGMSCDTRSLPDDVAVNPFRAYLHREIARAQGAGQTQVCFPFYAFVRNDDRPDDRRFYRITDTVLIQDQGPVVLPALDQGNVSVVHVSVPYYHQNESFTERGLCRLFKVSVLRNPDFDWTQLDRFSQPDTGVKMQLVSYAYAKWVNPITGANDGLRMRQRISQVRPMAGLPATGIGDVVGVGGPYTVADQGLLTPIDGATAQTQPVLTPLYFSLFRVNPQDGVWYRSGGLAPEVAPPPFAFAFPPPYGLGTASNASVKVFQ